jgi:aminopeptidase
MPMPDSRLESLANILIDHSLRLCADETLLIECFDLGDPTLPRLLVRKAAARGAGALVEMRENRILRELMKHGSEASLRTWGEVDRHRMERVQAYLDLRGAWNISEMTDIPTERMDL